MSILDWVTPTMWLEVDIRNLLSSLRAVRISGPLTQVWKHMSEQLLTCDPFLSWLTWVLGISMVKSLCAVWSSDTFTCSHGRGHGLETSNWLLWSDHSMYRMMTMWAMLVLSMDKPFFFSENCLQLPGEDMVLLPWGSHRFLCEEIGRLSMVIWADHVMATLFTCMRGLREKVTSLYVWQDSDWISLGLCQDHVLYFHSLHSNFLHLVIY